LGGLGARERSERTTTTSTKYQKNPAELGGVFIYPLFFTAEPQINLFVR
jgi:hypothetical protein